jgi:uncharacterized protein
MVGRNAQINTLQEILKENKSSFVAITGRRRVGKTYLIDQIFGNYLCFRVTGIQDANQDAQILNFTQKIAEFSNIPIVTPPENWQQVLILLKKYLETLPKTKKHVIFLDELPWISTARSGFIQFLAHIWNDYLSKQKQFILVICGSATSWITKKIINDRGGFHNRVSHTIKLKPFTLRETKAFIESKKINWSNNAIAEIYMAFGGIPYYLDDIRKGESVATTIERMCFSENGILRYEYDNLYKALFNYPQNHEAIIKTLAMAHTGLTRDQILKLSKVQPGGPYTRAMEDLIMSGFISELIPFGKKKQGIIYILTDEYSIFYHRFIHNNTKIQKGIWPSIAQSQKYKIWSGYAFESLCIKHMDDIKRAMGIAGVYTEYSSYKQNGINLSEGYQIDILIDRRDQVINICECKYYNTPIKIDKIYGQKLIHRKHQFKLDSGTKKTVFNTLITNQKVITNEYSLEAIDQVILLDDMM